MKKILALLGVLCFAPLFVFGAEDVFIGIEIPLTAACGAKNSQEECRVSPHGIRGLGIFTEIPYDNLYLLGGVSKFSFETESQRFGETPRKSALSVTLIEAGAAFPLGRIKRGYPFYFIAQGLLGSVRATNNDENDPSVALGGKFGAMFAVNRWHFLGTMRFIESRLGSKTPQRLSVSALGISYKF